MMRIRPAFFFILVLSLSIISCRQQTASSSEQEQGLAAKTAAAVQPTPLVIGWMTPVQLTGVETLIPLDDYFTDRSRVDSVVAPMGMQAGLSDDKSTLSLRIIGDLGFFSTLRIWAGGDSYDVLLKTPVKKKAVLRLRDQGFKKVMIKGEMNAWNPQTAVMKLANGIWEYEFELNPGNYQYLFVADGKEMLDPKNPQRVSNGIGGFNSLLSLKQADERKLPKIHTLRYEGSAIEIGMENQGAIFAFWENKLLPVQREKGKFVIEIPEEASARGRSYIRVYGQNETGVSNDILIPVESGMVLKDPAALTRHDPEAQIMYFVLVDRFSNGNAANDKPVKDERVLPQANFQGGDLAGITKKIRDGYFKSMNVNAIWLSPITQNPEEAYQEFPEPRRWYTGYHGYWPILSAKVDHRFGTSQEMREMVQAAHENGINILLDYVCNHVHELHPIYQRHPEWATQLDLPDGTKNIRIWDEQRLTTWFDTFIPTLDLENPEVIELQTDSTIYWIKEYGLDGFRHDATKHIPEAFWRRLTQKLKTQVMGPEGRKLYQIGETYGSRELIASYIGSGMLDAQFDFNLYFDSREVLARKEGSFESLVSSLNESFRYFGHHSSMGYISGNHDQARFISLAGGDLRFDEDHRDAAFNRSVGVGDPVGYKRLQMLHAFNMSIPGVPVIYYGDEIGMPGAGDPDSRRMMRFEGWSEEEQATKNTVDKLSQLRKNRLSLIYGDTEILSVSASTLALGRFYFEEATVAVFNKSDKPQKLRFELPARFEGAVLTSQFGNVAAQKGRTVEVELPPNSFDYLIHP
jgi:cyclomaltodextrinase / maltogenic alpha-amylase / neopullulanase